MLNLTKRRELRISRGSTGSCTCILVKLKSEGFEGWGAACPFSVGHHGETVDELTAALERLATLLLDYSPFERQSILDLLRSQPGMFPSAALAALDTAMLDWLGKKVDLPLWRLFGLDIRAIPPTSVTVGMENPEVARNIAFDWLKGELSAGKLFPHQGGRFSVMKVKLGSPEGIDADKARVDSVAEEVGDAEVIVDANGAWDLQAAREMSVWLHGRGVELLEQPLGVDAGENDWRRLRDSSDIAVFADESCFCVEDIYAISGGIDGIVIKMMKCGGLSEALRMVSAARACGLLVMLGCYGETVLSNSAMAQISPLADYVDLDSHFNLLKDPFQGAEVRGGRLVPNDEPGIGVTLDNA